MEMMSVCTHPECVYYWSLFLFQRPLHPSPPANPTCIPRPHSLASAAAPGMCPLQAPTPDPEAFATGTTHTATDHVRRRHMLSLLLLEYEGLLQEYLSCNWDRLAELAEANKGAVRWEGPVCVWHRSPSVPSVADSSDGESERGGNGLGGVDANPQFRRRLSTPTLRNEEDDALRGRCVCCR